MSRPGLRDPGLAAASGLALGAAFLPGVPGVLAWVALVPLLAALERRVADGGPRSWFTLGYTGGAAFFLVGTHWIALLNDVALTIGWLKYVGWIAGALYLALFWGVAAWIAGLLARRSGVAARWTFVPVFVVVEAARGAGDLGFPWFQPGYTQHALVPVIQMAAVGGVTLVTAWLLVLNAAVLTAWRRRSPRAIAIALLVLGVPIGAGAWTLRARTAPDGPAIALVQGNIPGEKKWSGNHTVEIFQEFFRLSRSVADEEPRLVIWPETATGTYVRRMPDQSVAVAQLAARMRAPVFMGFAHYTFGADGKPVVWNSAGGWNPDGSLTEVYSKRHLVPFGERVPFQRWFPMLGKWDLGQAEWQPGTGPVIFPGPDGIPMSMLICFESIFPSLARADVRAGSRLLVNITNDEWFGNGAALVQHAAMAPFRAVENRVPVARCANTGLTEMIDAYGVVTAVLPVFEPRVLVAPVPAAGALTPWTRFGDWCARLAMVLMALLVWAPWRVRRDPV